MPEYDYITDQIFTVSDFFSADECRSYIDLAERIGFEDSPINTAFGPQIRKDVRNNTRVMLDDSARVEDLASRMLDYVPHRLGAWKVCGVNERLRFYRYDVGQQFDWHYDGYFERPNGERSRLTFMIYLNEGFTGGETAFEEASVAPETGKALFFIHQILHTGKPVVEGRKYVLRTDVMYRRENN